MMEPDFDTDEEMEEVDDKKTYRIELVTWHVVICLIMCWMITSKITQSLTKTFTKYLQHGSLLVKYVVLDPRRSRFTRLQYVMSMTDFILVTIMLLGGLIYYLYIALMRSYVHPEGTVKCNNVEFAVFLCGLFIIAVGIIKQSILLGLSIKYISKTLACTWTISITFVIFLYHSILPNVPLPLLEVCLQQKITCVDIVHLLLVTIVVTILVLSARNCKRLYFKDSIFMHHLKTNISTQQYMHLDASNITEETVKSHKQCMPKEEIQIHNFTESIQLYNSHGSNHKLASGCDGFEITNPGKLQEILVILSSVLSLWVIFVLIGYIQEIEFDIKLLFVGIIQMCLSLLTMLIRPVQSQTTTIVIAGHRSHMETGFCHFSCGLSSQFG